jgi:hypothetical protein
LRGIVTKPSLGVLLVLLACGPSSSSSGDDGPDAAAPACNNDIDCGPGKRCESGGCVDNRCGGESLDLTYVPPNLLLVVDRSCSMTKVLTSTTTSKWQVAVDGINKVITSYGSDIRWGLTLFPDTTPAACTQQDFAFPLGDGNGPGIQTLLANALVTTDPFYPDGPCVTNIDTAVMQAETDPGLADPSRRSYLMLVTDGAQSSGCTAGGGDPGSEMAVKKLLKSGVKTFVLGFGNAVDVAQLDALAIAGGAPLPGTTKYFRADTAGELDQALQTIADAVVGCSYKVDPPPEDPSQVYVWFGGTEHVPRDPSQMTGWDYDAATQTVTLYGSYCDRVKAKMVKKVDVIFGCPSSPVL